MRICIVAANYYPKITSNMLKGCLSVFKKYNIKNYKIIMSPGIFEIPVIISRNLKSYEAMIALGCVIKGDTPHFDFISKATFDGIINLSINHKKPIGNGIITCLNKSQALVRSDPSKKNKGGEAAKAALSVLGILKNESR